MPKLSFRGPRDTRISEHRSREMIFLWFVIFIAVVYVMAFCFKEHAEDLFGFAVVLTVVFAVFFLLWMAQKIL